MRGSRRPSTATACAGVAAAFALSFAQAAHAEPLAARDTALVRPKGTGSIGVFAPLRVSVGRGLEAEAHPLLFLAASPNLALRVRLFDDGALRVTGEYGLSVPTMAMRLTQGILFPTWDTSHRRVGWFVVPDVGVAVSYGRTTVVTARIDTAFGLGFGANEATPLDTVAPLELLFAPMLNGFRSHAGVGYDFPITTWLRGRAAFDVWYVGRSPEPFKSPLYVSTQVGVDIKMGPHTRLALGAIWYDYDQRQTIVRKSDSGFYERVRVRSDDFFPTADFVWSW